MAKLVATYAAGMFSVFTENRTGMQQRAAIDIGDIVPTPEAMAKLAGSMADQWGWVKVIDASSPAPVQLPTTKRARDDSDPKPNLREQLIVDWLAANPGKHDARAIIRGLGLEDSDKRVARWYHTFQALRVAQRIVSELDAHRTGNNLVRRYLYSVE